VLKRNFVAADLKFHARFGAQALYQKKKVHSHANLVRFHMKGFAVGFSFEEAVSNLCFQDGGDLQHLIIGTLRGKTKFFANVENLSKLSSNGEHCNTNTNTNFLHFQERNNNVMLLQ